MSKIDLSKFDEIVERAEQYNKRNGFKRFYTIRAKEGKIAVYGMYDYQTKKFVRSLPFEDFNKIFNEIDVMVRQAGNPPKRAF